MLAPLAAELRWAAVSTDDIDRIEARSRSRRADGPVAPAMAMRGLRGVGWVFLDMSKLPLYLGTISPTYMERSFQDVKWGAYERQAAIREVAVIAAASRFLAAAAMRPLLSAI